MLGICLVNLWGVRWSSLYLIFILLNALNSLPYLPIPCVLTLVFYYVHIDEICVGARRDLLSHRSCDCHQYDEFRNLLELIRNSFDKYLYIQFLGIYENSKYDLIFYDKTLDRTLGNFS